METTKSFFTNYGFLIHKSKRDKVIGKGELSQGLYFFKPPINNVSCVTCNVSYTHNCREYSCSVMAVSTPILHARLGHLSDPILNIVQNKISSLFPLNFNLNSKFCTVSPLSKFHRLHFIAHYNYFF